MNLFPNTLYNTDCFQYMKQVPSKYYNLLYTDVPYNMGSEYIIDKLGHYRLKGKGTDFMNKWEVGDGLWWYDWFQEAYRIIKEGGFLVTHNIDRQSDLWSYYARRSGFLPLQKLYWLFIDSFPKGVDTALQIDNMLGVERDVIGTAKGAQAVSTGRYGNWGKNSLYKKGKDQSMIHHDYLSGKMSEYDKTVATSELAKKYDGYKHGIAPVKQVVEEILVFWKRPEQNVPRTIQLFENEIQTGLRTSLHPSVFNIKDTRVAPTKKLTAPDRWTPQLCIDTRIIQPMVEQMNHEESFRLIDVLPKIPFTDEDMIPYNYCKKPNITEKEFGLGSKKGERLNTHPTSKPVALAEWVIKLFMIPDKDEMRGFDPFAGTGTIPIAFQNLGIEWNGTELSKEFHAIAQARIDGYKEHKTSSLFGEAL